MSNAKHPPAALTTHKFDVFDLPLQFFVFLLILGIFCALRQPDTNRSLGLW